jgi:hypothetical protein
MKTSFLPFLALSSSICFSLNAQTTLPSSPSNATATPKIVLAPPSGESAWTVTYKYELNREAYLNTHKADIEANLITTAALARPVKVSYVVKNPVSHRLVQFEGDLKEEGYQMMDTEFQIVPNQPGVYTVNLANYPTPEQLFRKKFPGVHWVKPKLFVGIVTAYGQQCAYFRSAPISKPNADTPDTNAEKADFDKGEYTSREAWFNTQTGLPIAYKEGSTTCEYKFEAPPQGNISVPPEVRAAVAKMAAYDAYKKKQAATFGKRPKK